MQNAHLRMGKLTFVRQTRDTITNVTVGLNCLVAEPMDSQTATTLHLVSVFGGDQDIGAVIAAAHEALRLKVAIGAREFIGTLGEKVELRWRGMVEELIGLNCSPIAVKGTKLRLLRILSQGLRRKAIEIPPELPAVAGAPRESSSRV